MSVTIRAICVIRVYFEQLVGKLWIIEQKPGGFCERICENLLIS